MPDDPVVDVLRRDGFRLNVFVCVIVIGKAGRIGGIIDGLEYFRIRLQLLLMSDFLRLQFRLSFFIFLFAASANLVSLVSPDLSLWSLDGMSSAISSKSDSDSKLLCG